MSAQLVNEWSEIDSGLNIKDIQDTYVKESLAQLLQNQKEKNLDRELFSEGFGTGVGSVSVANSPAGNVPAGGPANGVFAPISMALVRRTFPALFANKIVGVQAMNTPIGLAYAMRYVYEGTSNEVGFDGVPEFSGFTGSTSGTSGTADAGTAVATNVAEAWKIGQAATDVYPELSFRIDRQPIEAKTRKLATSFSLEAAMDVKAMHNIDIERDLINMIQYEMVAEQDRELLASVKAAAQRTGTMDTTDGNALTGISWGGEANLTYNMATGDGRWSQEKFSNLITFITDLTNKIAIKTRRGAGNFVVVSPRVATALQAAGPQFSRNTAFIDATTVFPEVGVINDSIKVYRDQYATTDYVLAGYKGPGNNDCGVIYSPYVTGLTNRAIAQDDFSPRIGVMSRYAITDTLLGSGRYYRFATITGLSDLLNGVTPAVTYTSAV
tara:strand:- start:9803 stop:11122 length:1320 start_codon:yes stop_codon:yes gene_type:complete